MGNAKIGSSNKLGPTALLMEKSKIGDNNTIAPGAIVYDQIGTPTYAGDLAEAIHRIVSSGEWKPGIYHFTDEGVASWYDFTKAIFEIAGRDVKVNPIKTSEYPTQAKRPLYSVLSKKKIKKAFGLEIPYWRDSLKTCISQLKQIGRAHV